MGNIEGNIWKLYVIRASRWFMVAMPVIVLFFQDLGLSVREVFILQTVFALTVIFLEVPSGYIADLLGRKLTLVTGAAFSVIGFGMYAVADGFWMLLFGEMVVAVSTSFISGADVALLYDSLLQMGREKEFGLIQGKMLSWGSFSEGVAGILGGVLALVSLRTPVIFQVFIMFLSVPLAFSLVEPIRHKLDTTKSSWSNIIRIVKYSLHEHAEIKWLVVYAGVVSASTLAMVWFIQPYFTFVELPLLWFGVAWAALQFSVAIFFRYAHDYERWMGRRRALISLVVLSFLGYLLLSSISVLWGIVFIFLFYFVRGIHNVVLTDYINRLVSSDIRATVLSVKAMMSRVIFALVGPFVGWIADVWTLQTALFCSGFIFLVLGVFSLLMLHRWKVL
jgi:MFS family permease